MYVIWYFSPSFILSLLQWGIDFIFFYTFFFHATLYRYSPWKTGNLHLDSSFEDSRFSRLHLIEVITYINCSIAKNKPKEGIVALNTVLSFLEINFQTTDSQRRYNTYIRKICFELRARAHLLQCNFAKALLDIMPLIMLWGESTHELRDPYLWFLIGEYFQVLITVAIIL